MGKANGEFTNLYRLADSLANLLLVSFLCQSTFSFPFGRTRKWILIGNRYRECSIDRIHYLKCRYHAKIPLNKFQLPRSNIVSVVAGKCLLFRRLIR